MTDSPQSTEPIRPRPRQFALVVLAFVALFALQAVRLDSDPSFLKRFNDFGDEGYWQHNARCKVLFGQWLPDDFNQAFIAAPLFTFMQWGVFSVAGVSIATARLMPLATMWLLLLTWYAILRREFSPRFALGIVLALGIAHEMLIYVKWSTPIVPEMCCWTFVAYFIQSGVRGRALWFLPAGLSLAAATAMKISAAYSYPGIALYLAVAILVRRECDWKRAAYFLAGALLGLGGLIGFLAANLEQYRRFQDSIGAAALSHRPGIGEALRSILVFPLSDFFCYPSSIWIVFLASLWGCEWLTRIMRIGLLSSLRAMSQLECYCACWLIGCAVVLAITPDKIERRLRRPGASPVALGRGVRSPPPFCRAHCCLADDRAGHPATARLPALDRAGDTGRHLLVRSTVLHAVRSRQGCGFLDAQPPPAGMEPGTARRDCLGRANVPFEKNAARNGLDGRAFPDSHARFGRRLVRFRRPFDP